MTRTTLGNVTLLLCLAATTSAGAMDYAAHSLRSDDSPVRDRTIAAMRALGPDGLENALAAYDQLQEQRSAQKEQRQRLVVATKAGIPAKGEGSVMSRLAAVEADITKLDTELARLRDAIDQIGGQRSCSVSRLYWYTDLERAQAEAERTGRPILSLRMLGRLTDEFSCANSRFFRTTLYSNEQIGDFLRDHFVLHWQSVRPVPRVTIDFGDGRVLERTVTGNSAHYVLTSDGLPLDVLPGLYSPQEFQNWLGQMLGLHTRCAAATSADRAELLRTHHIERGEEVLRRWNRDIERLGANRAELVLTRATSRPPVNAPDGNEELPRPVSPPTARKAARIAATKSGVEVPAMRFANLGGEKLERGMDDELWQAIAAMHRPDVKLDEPSIAVMRSEFPTARAAGRLAVSKRVQEDPVMRMVRNFEDSIAVDTVRNEYLLHRRIHERFAGGDAVTGDVDALNEWVYAELFLTPSSDPWLGLAPADVYTALENGGQVERDRLTRNEQY